MKKNGIVRLFYKGKRCKKTNTDNIIAMLLPSVLGIILCAVCLMGSTWAWFAATYSTGTQTIQARNYTVSVQVNNSSLEINHPTTFEKGEYTVTLTAGGNATTGYCKVKLGNSEKLTQQFPPEESITFTLVLNETTMVEFIPCWGASIVDDIECIRNGDMHTYGTATVAEDNSFAGENGETTELPADTAEDTTTEETTPAATEPTETQPQTEVTTEPTGETTGATTEITVPEDTDTEGNPSESDGNE